MNDENSPHHESDALPHGGEPLSAPSVETPPRVPLRIAVGVMLVLGMAGGWWAMNQQRTQKQLLAVHALQQAGCKVYFEYQWKNGRPLEGVRPPEARWIRALLGDAAFRHAVAVDARSSHDLDAVFDNLRFLPYLQYLDLSEVQLPESATARLSNLSSLQVLNLANTGVTDADMVRLSQLVHLTKLSLAGTNVSDRCTDHVIALHQLKDLDVSRTRIGRDAIRTLQRRLPKCKIVGTVPPVSNSQ